AGKEQNYTLQDVETNEWSIGGTWKIGPMESESLGERNTLRFKFTAKEVYLVMDGPKGATVTMTIDGKAVTDNRGGGADVGEAGRVHLDGARLYKLINLPTFTKDTVLDITIPKGVTVNAFTFGS